MAERRYSISQAGRLVGVENHVLRYWEDELHLEIPRDRKNQRYYTKLHIEMFQKINELKEKGYQLKAIEPVLKRMLAGETDLNLSKILMENATEILRQAHAGKAGVQMKAETVYRYAEEERLGERKSEKPGREEKSLEKANLKEEKTGEEHRKETKAEMGEEEAKPEAQVLEDADLAGFEAERYTDDSRNKKESVGNDMNGDAETGAVTSVRTEGGALSQQEKLEQFQLLMNHIIGNAIGQAMRQNNEALSEEISRQVNDRMVQELEYMMRISDEKEEERFKALDEALRAHQKENKGKAEAAAARMPFFRKKKFGRSGKKL